jgi:hypothetical protein
VGAASGFSGISGSVAFLLDFLVFEVVGSVVVLSEADSLVGPFSAAASDF